MSDKKFNHGTNHEAYVMLHQVTLDIKEELKRAAFKHGMENTPVANQDSNLKVLIEEMGEAAEVCICHHMMVRAGKISRFLTYDEGDKEKLEAELIQVATMAAAWVVGLRMAGPREDV